MFYIFNGNHYGKPKTENVTMRVLQLVDSLRPGGAERMAVTYANALVKRIERSYLCCTRLEGLLRNQLSPEVNYMFLKRHRTLDFKAFWKLRTFVSKNQINIIQAHSSSWFLALMVKMSLPNVTLVWHDHYGRQLKERRAGVLRLASSNFDGIISVNQELRKWAEKDLRTKHVRFFRNFLPVQELDAKSPTRKSEKDKNINLLCLANLRPQKDHFNLLEAFVLVKEEYPNLILNLVGTDEEDDYSEELKKYVRDQHLQDQVIFHGNQENVAKFLFEADLGVLASRSEGLPLALLEYGFAGLPVVCTDVGQCAEVLGDSGKIVEAGDAKALAGALLFYLEGKEQRKRAGFLFQQKVLHQYSEDVVLPRVVQFLEELRQKKDRRAQNRSKK